MTRLRGTAQGSDQVNGPDDTCSGFHVTGGGVTQSRLGDGTYTEDLCAVPDETGLNYSLTGTWDTSTAKGDLSGSVSGEVVYSNRDFKYHYNVAIMVTGGTQAFAGAQGTIRVGGIGDFYYDDATGSFAVDDTLTFSGNIRV
jgi:hypothetical protein